MTLRFQVIVALGLYILLLLVSLIYWPGLEGPYLFDDKPNLSVMNNYGGITNLENLGRFLLEAPGSSGRPLSLLTFALNDQAWPLDLFSVKFTNLAIHLLVVISAFAFLRKVILLSGKSEVHANISALAIASVFAIHPLNVSTVLYAIQRMTELSALFVFLAVFAFLKLYPTEYRGRLDGIKLWTAGVALGVLCSFGVLAKENAFLAVPLSAVCVYSLRMKPSDVNSTHYMLWKFCFWFSPVILFFVYYFLVSGQTFSDAWVRREFDLVQRLLTESNIVFDYLVRVVLPSSIGGGLYHDDYTISTGLLEPVKTLITLLVHLSIVVTAFIYRTKAPLYTLGVLWFYVGHSLESTFIPLELYFEHRNYLPMIGVLLAIYALLEFFLGTIRLKGVVKTLSVVVFGGICLLLLTQRVAVWADEQLLIELWAEESPTSSRSQMQLVGLKVEQGEPEIALEAARRAQVNIPNDLSFYLAELYIKCISDISVNKNEITTAVDVAHSSVYENASYNLLREMTSLIKEGSCKGFGFEDLMAVYNALGKNEKFMAGKLYRSNYHYFKGKLFSDMGDLNSAVIELDKAYRYKKNATFPLQQANWLASAGLIQDARRYLEIAEQTPPRTKYIKIGNDQLIESARKNIDRFDKYWSSKN